MGLANESGWHYQICGIIRSKPTFGQNVSESTKDQTSEVAQLLARWQGGDARALSALFPHVYAELRRIAAAELRGQVGHETLQPTALVNDMFVRLLGAQTLEFSDRKHFFATAAGRNERERRIECKIISNSPKRAPAFETQLVTRFPRGVWDQCLLRLFAAHLTPASHHSLGFFGAH